MFKAGGKTIRYEIHKLIISIWNKEELSEVARCHNLVHGNFDKNTNFKYI